MARFGNVRYIRIRLECQGRDVCTDTNTVYGSMDDSISYPENQEVYK